MPNKDPEVVVVRSKRRKRSVGARFIGKDRIEVVVPEGLPPAAEKEAVENIVARIRKKYMATAISDADLVERANKLNAKILAGQARFRSIRWVSNQRRRWGSCSVDTGEIRISDRLRNVPDYVLDSIIVHELVHTFIYSGHSAEFWQWADRAPQAERAKGFLDAYALYA